MYGTGRSYTAESVLSVYYVGTCYRFCASGHSDHSLKVYRSNVESTTTEVGVVYIVGVFLCLYNLLVIQRRSP